MLTLLAGCSREVQENIRIRCKEKLTWNEKVSTYLTGLLYFPEQEMGVVIPCNSSNCKEIKITLLKCLLEIGKEARDL